MLPHERAKAASRQGDRVVQAISKSRDGKTSVFLVDPVEWGRRGALPGGCSGRWAKGVGPCQIGERIDNNGQPTGQIIPAGSGGEQ